MAPMIMYARAIVFSWFTPLVYPRFIKGIRKSLEENSISEPEAKSKCKLVLSVTEELVAFIR